MGFQPTQVQTSFSLWERVRWQQQMPRGQEAASIQEGRVLLWNECADTEVGQRKEFEKHCGEWNTKIYFKMKDVWKKLGTRRGKKERGRETWKLKWVWEIWWRGTQKDIVEDQKRGERLLMKQGTGRKGQGRLFGKGYRLPVWEPGSLFPPHIGSHAGSRAALELKQQEELRHLWASGRTKTNGWVLYNLGCRLNEL